MAESRDRAAILLGWAAALRRTELVGLEVSNVRFCAEGLLVYLGRTKADQEGRGEVVAVNHAQKHKPLCAVAAMQDWLQRSGIECGPLFPRLDQRGQSCKQAMSDKNVDRLVKHYAEAARLQLDDGSMQWSAHSLRAGCATEAARAGKMEWQIMRHTRHRSHETLAKYIRLATPFEDTAGDLL